MAEFGEVLETVMMICFGISWPLSVYKSYKSKSTSGKSFVFLFAIWIGYVAGIFGKLMMNNVTCIRRWRCSWATPSARRFMSSGMPTTVTASAGAAEFFTTTT